MLLVNIRRLIIIINMGMIFSRRIISVLKTRTSMRIKIFNKETSLNKFHPRIIKFKMKMEMKMNKKINLIKFNRNMRARRSMMLQKK